jgi:hypothetical protein
LRTAISSSHTHHLPDRQTRLLYLHQSSHLCRDL